jgi:hypothetical protein
MTPMNQLLTFKHRDAPQGASLQEPTMAKTKLFTHKFKSGNVVDVWLDAKDEYFSELIFEWERTPPKARDLKEYEEVVRPRAVEEFAKARQLPDDMKAVIVNI